MARDYPRHYVIVKKGETKEVTVKDPIHEWALTLAHPEAVGLNQPETFDESQFVITDED